MYRELLARVDLSHYLSHFLLHTITFKYLKSIILNWKDRVRCEGVIFVHRAQFAMSKDIFSCYNWWIGVGEVYGI